MHTIKTYAKVFLDRIGLLDRLRRLHGPQVTRPTLHLGSAYGGWVVCPTDLSADSIVYSFGVGVDASFDRAVIENYNTQVFAFDPTPGSIAWVADQKWPLNFKFFPWGLAARDGTRDFHPPGNPDHISHTILDLGCQTRRPIQVEMYQLSTIAKRLGHQKIDVLKMDIEGAEYEVIENIVELEHVSIGQILVEFHHFYPDVPRRQTRNAVHLLNASGYCIFHISPSGHEYSFVKL